jgi:hypothetical protein
MVEVPEYGFSFEPENWIKSSSFSLLETSQTQDEIATLQESFASVGVKFYIGF